MTLLSRLPTIRASVDAEVLSPAAAFGAYSNIMNAIFAVYAASEQVNNDLSVDKQTDASLDAAQALEFASREATLVGGASAAHGQMTTGDRHLFANAVTSQRLLIASALGEFDAQLRAPWEHAYTSPAHQQVRGPGEPDLREHRQPGRHPGERQDLAGGLPRVPGRDAEGTAPGRPSAGRHGEPPQ